MSDPAIGPDDDATELREQTTTDDQVAFDEDPDAIQESIETVTNDAVAGETVDPEPGDGTANGPTGGAPREGEPILWENDGEDEPESQGVDFGNDEYRSL
ncbi:MULTISPECIES: hypothetical protein [unclassified Curtobacterium]|uniref:hypothetical protein n=1 Tax=unclassified Curtobacterium TaxID=257496 RepID=UPI000DA8B593|nr:MULTISPECIES: hypothetical protein [unclassified Curtobacterium]PZE28037.1 hypothetical protein DEI86_05475 [Curtobacterium sp. MCBD17_028]PZE72081.1 hypothetical protein DEI82_14890 [Curtobacterium sp. MCBD17_019]PZF62348.1 hypothetical protein DEI92_02315 [Curtobacterium sp. MCBD17_034]PZF63777.1 hypothetical protein DEI81_06685 [Curtobacterium sp. MCBD17_013]PZM39945.1 hypothetical protein DEI90_03790 [Curtobacterium sp. MCBD17_031]